MKIYNTVRNGMALKSSQKETGFHQKDKESEQHQAYSNNETSKTEKK